MADASAIVPFTVDTPQSALDYLHSQRSGEASRRWVEPMITNIIHWNKLDRGGHFAAFEQPELFVDELRTCFRKVR